MDKMKIDIFAKMLFNIYAEVKRCRARRPLKRNNAARRLLNERVPILICDI